MYSTTVVQYNFTNYYLTSLGPIVVMFLERFLITDVENQLTTLFMF